MHRDPSLDLVLLDVQMPGIDGLQTLERLRQLRPRLKVLMCSCLNDPHTVLEAILMGAQGYLTKPLRDEDLDAALRRCLKPRYGANA